MPHRVTRRYRILRAALMDRVKTEGGTCCIPTEGCPRTFDFSLHYLDPWAFTVHHPQARAIGGAVEDPANMYPAHRRCNEKAGVTGKTTPPEDTHSEDWLGETLAG